VKNIKRKKNKIKNELMDEIIKLTKQIDELKIENEKIKYNYSNQKSEKIEKNIFDLLKKE
jgi:hypothetical protein